MDQSQRAGESFGLEEERVEERKLTTRDRVVENFKIRLEKLPGNPLEFLDKPIFVRILLKNLRFFPPRDEFEIRVFDIDEILRESNTDSHMTPTELHRLQNELYLSLKECGVIIQDRYQKTKLD